MILREIFTAFQVNSKHLEKKSKRKQNKIKTSDSWNDNILKYIYT